MIDEWRRAGVEVVFLNRPLGQSPEDDLLLQVQGIVAEYERAKIMERSRRGKKHAAKRGPLNVMSNAPFGYRYVRVHDGGGQARFEPIPERAGVVKQVFLWIARDRCSLGEVCRRLQIAGERTQLVNNVNRSLRERQGWSCAHFDGRWPLPTNIRTCTEAVAKIKNGNNVLMCGPFSLGWLILLFSDDRDDRPDLHHDPCPGRHLCPSLGWPPRRTGLKDRWRWLHRPEMVSHGRSLPWCAGPRNA